MTNNKNAIFIMLLSYLAFTNCLLKIPFKAIKIKGDSKKVPIKNLKPISESEKDFRTFASIDYDYGLITLNNNYLFLTELEIGTPGQTFNLILDTLTNILWVSSSSSTIDGIKNTYSAKKSTTSKETGETFNLNVGSGRIRGNLFTDQFKYIGQNFNMKFLVASSVRFSLGGADGVIGLGGHYEDEEMSFLHMLKKNDVTDSTSFSILFDGIIEKGATGQLILGKHSNFTGKNSVTFPLAKGTNKTDIKWNLTINGYGLKKEKNEINYNKSFNVLLDTAHDHIMLPYEMLNDTLDILSGMDCEPNKVDDGFNLKCLKNNTLPDLVLKINGYDLKIPFNYTFSLNYVHHYSTIIFTDQNYYALGAPFFFAFHTLFDGEKDQIQVCPNDPSFLEKSKDKKDDKGQDKDKDKDKDKDGGDSKDGDSKDGDSKDGDKKSKKTKWYVYAAIAGGALLLIILLIIIICCCCCKSKNDDDLEKGVDNTDPIVENDNDNENN